jgi:hypothetical protein
MLQPMSASACRTASADNDGLHDEDAHSEDAHSEAGCSEAGCSEAGCSEAGAARQSVHEIETAAQMRDVLSRCALVAGLHPDQVRSAWQMRCVLRACTLCAFVLHGARWIVTTFGWCADACESSVVQTFTAPRKSIVPIAMSRLLF